MIPLVVHWAADPVAFHIFGFGVRWYSLFFAVGFILAYCILAKMFKNERVQSQYLDKFTIYIFVALLLGLRLGHCFFYEWSYYSSHLLEIIVPYDFEKGEFTGYQGLASHGGAIGILLGMALYCYKTKVNPIWILDRLVIVIPMVGAFVRCGNLMNSEIYGIETTLPWGFVYELRYETVPKHPTQLYEAISYLLIFAGLMVYYFKKQGKMRPGLSFGVFLTVLFGMRFLIEFVKEDQEAFEQDMILNMGQCLSIPFILAGIVFMVLACAGKLSGNVFYKNTEQKSYSKK